MSCLVVALGEAFFWTRGFIHFSRTGACSLLSGGLARGLDVNVCLGLDRVGYVRARRATRARTRSALAVSDVSKFGGPLRLHVHGNT
jgi:hypothetical protein